MSRVHTRQAVTLVEMLMALAIGAILMASLTGAVTEMCTSYVVNTSQDVAVRTARLAISKMCNGVRQASNGTILVTPAALFLEQPGGKYDVYLHENGQTLKYYKDYTGSTTLPLATGASGYVLARDVSAISFKGRRDGTGRLIKVEVRMTVSPENGSFTLSDSAVCRRNRSLPDPNDPNPVIQTGSTYVNPPPL